MTRRLLVAVVAALVLAAMAVLPALGATPSSGTVSAAAPTANWSGTVTDPTGATELLAIFNGGTYDSVTGENFCHAPACDTFTLSVLDPGARLDVRIYGWDPDVVSLGVEVEDPAGNRQFVDPDDSGENFEATATVTNPIKGDYIIRVVGTPEADTFDYTATAKLTPGPPPAPAPAPAPTSEPAQPSPGPAPQPTPAPAPAPGRPALSLHPDRRALARAVTDGFRVRLQCRNGCATVRVRVYVSALTANQRLRKRDAPKFTGDVLVGGSRVLRNAEGRHTALVRFNRRYRKRLAPMRRLTLAVEAVASDASRKERAALKRMTLVKTWWSSR